MAGVEEWQGLQSSQVENTTKVVVEQAAAESPLEEEEKMSEDEHEEEDDAAPDAEADLKLEKEDFVVESEGESHNEEEQNEHSSSSAGSQKPLFKGDEEDEVSEEAVEQRPSMDYEAEAAHMEEDKEEEAGEDEEEREDGNESDNNFSQIEIVSQDEEGSAMRGKEEPEDAFSFLQGNQELARLLKAEENDTPEHYKNAL